MRVRLIVLAALLAVVVPGVSGCGQIDAMLNPKPKVITQEATVAVAGASVQGQLEAEMPEGLPLWPDAVVTDSTLSKVPGGKSWAASFTTTDVYDDVYKGMGAGFQRAGWTVESVDTSVPEAKSATFTVQKDNVEGVVSISQVDSGTVSIDYVMGPAQ